MAPEIAVVVASHDRPLRLRWLLEALSERTLERDRFEAVAHDSAGSETDALLEAHPLTRHGTLRHVRRPPGSSPPGAPRARRSSSSPTTIAGRRASGWPRRCRRLTRTPARSSRPRRVQTRTSIACCTRPSTTFSGWWKAVWVFFLIVVPFLTALVYLIARGHGMRERAIQHQADLQKAGESYIKQVAGYSPVDELHKLNALREKGAISQQEFDSLKAKIVAA